MLFIHCPATIYEPHLPSRMVNGKCSVIGTADAFGQKKAANTVTKIL